MAPSYHRLGAVPAKRHVAFRAPDGSLYAEEVVGTEGFSGRYSILYHRYAPTRVVKVGDYGLAQAFDAAGLGGQTRTGAGASATLLLYPREAHILVEPEHVRDLLERATAPLADAVREA